MKNAFEEYQITNVFDKAVKKYDDIFMVKDLNIGINIKSIGGSILNIRLTNRTKCFQKTSTNDIGLSYIFEILRYIFEKLYV